MPRKKQNKKLTAAASAARLRLESADARTDSGLTIDTRDVDDDVPQGRGAAAERSGLRRNEEDAVDGRVAAAAAAEAPEEEEAHVVTPAPLVLRMEARMVAKSRLMLLWRMRGFGGRRESAHTEKWGRAKREQGERWEPGKKKLGVRCCGALTLRFFRRKKNDKRRMAAALLAAAAGSCCGSSGSSASRLLLARLASALTASTSGSGGSGSSGSSWSSLRSFAADASASISSSPSPASTASATPSPRSRLLRQRKSPVALTPAAVERVKALLEKRQKVREIGIWVFGQRGFFNHRRGCFSASQRLLLVLDRPFLHSCMGFTTCSLDPRER